MNSLLIVHLEIAVMLLTMMVVVLGVYNNKKRYRRRLGALGGALFVPGFALTVVLSSLEKDRMEYQNTILPLCIIYAFGALLVLRNTIIMKSNHPGSDAIIQAFDKMDVGLCYCEDNGRVILCNENLHKISLALEGFRLLNGGLFIELVKEKAKRIVSNDIYEVEADGKVFYITVNNVEVKSQQLMEIKGVDVTTLHQKQQELLLENKRLEDINRRLNEYGQIADTIIKEQEILNAKIKIHDRFGSLLLSSKKAVEQEASEEILKQNIEDFKEILSVIVMNNKEDDNYFKELEEVASKIGVIIHLNGELPEDTKKNELCCLAIRECVTNTFKHTSGHNLYVNITNDQTTDRITVRINNDGESPDEEIMLGTGLSSLKSKVERNNGEFKLIQKPEYILEIRL